jgi:putative endopeptidase
MNTSTLLAGCLVLLLGGCATQPAPTPAPAPTPTVNPAPAPPPRSGLDLAGFDTGVRPADDLYRHAAGGWLARTQIPADRSNFGAFTVLADQAEADIHAILEDLSHRQYLVAGSEEQKVGDLYRSFLDTAALESAGLAPLQGELQQIDALRSKPDVVAYIGHAQQIGVYAGLAWSPEVDARNTKAYIGYLSQAGLSLPDRDYYLKTDQRYVEYRKALVSYIVSVLGAAGDTAPQATAARILSIETQLARVQWSKVQNRDPVRIYNKMTLAEVAQLAPQIDWPALLQSAGAPAEAFVVMQPSYIAALGKLVASISVADWKSYLRYRLIDDNAALLGARFDTPHFELYERTLQGVQQPLPRWKRAIQLIDGTMGEATGRLYVAQHFGAPARQRVRQLVANLLAAFRESIDQLEWMSPATRAEAQRKLAAYNIKIGYPDKWRDYSALQIAAGDLAGNIMRYERFELQRRVARMHGPVDRGEWRLTPQTINAYYEPSLNEIVFPAAILQPPFFDPAADDAVNYGAIGAVIGHEISHGFDDQGRQFDASGNLRDWWTTQDAARFKERAERLVAQYAAYTVLDGQHLNGQLTLGENIADLSGLAVAYRAWSIARSAAPAAQDTLDGYTGAQRFFLGWAQIWRRKYRDDNLRMRLSVDPHSFSEFRANGAATNLPAFYDAFAVTPSDKLYRAPADRVKIW